MTTRVPLLGNTYFNCCVYFTLYDAIHSVVLLMKLCAISIALLRSHSCFFPAQYFVDVIREQQLIEWGRENSNGGPFDESKELVTCRVAEMCRV